MPNIPHDNTYYKDTTVAINNDANLSITYRVYFTHDKRNVHRNIEVDMRWPDTNWCGDIVVVRCSQRSSNRFVNMRAGDDARSLRAIEQ